MESISSQYGDYNYIFNEEVEPVSAIPVEILTKIFSYSSPRDANTISKVCRYWYLVTKQSIIIEIEKLQNLLNFLEEHLSVKKISLKNEDQDSASNFLFLFKLKAIRRSLEEKLNESLTTVYMYGIDWNEELDSDRLIQALPVVINSKTQGFYLSAITYILARCGHFIKALEIADNLKKYWMIRKDLLEQAARGMFEFSLSYIDKGNTPITKLIFNILSSTVFFDYLCTLCLHQSMRDIEVTVKVINLFPDDKKDDIIIRLCEMLQKFCYDFQYSWIDKAVKLCRVAMSPAKLGCSFAHSCQKLAKDYPKDAENFLKLIPEGFYKELAIARIKAAQTLL